MDQAKEPSVAKQLQAIGVKKSHAYMLAWGKRSPSLPLALRIHRELGLKLGPLAVATDAEIKAFERVASREAAAQ